MIVKTLTWPRDSHGLFDYESKNLTKKSLKTQNTGRGRCQNSNLTSQIGKKRK
jgi:hypothetical protein